MMSEKLDWTQKLGDAFLAQQADVMDTIQKLRGKARDQGNLQDTPEQKVIVQGDAIEIQPANPSVIYVPTYNPTVVYGLVVVSVVPSLLLPPGGGNGCRRSAWFCLGGCGWGGLELGLGKMELGWA